LNESERNNHYGDFYVFDNDTASKFSFYDTINILLESEGDINIFLENWERSVDYQVGKLNEDVTSDMVGDPILYLSTQAWMVLEKFKSKGAEKVISVVKKLNQFEKKNPKTSKAVRITIKGLLAATAAYVVSQGVGLDIQALSSALQNIDATLAKDVIDVAQNITPDVAGDFISDQKEIISRMSAAVSDIPGMEEIKQLSDQISQDLISAGDQIGTGIGLDQQPFQAITSHIEKIFNSRALKDEAGIDIRAGLKYLAGSESPLTEKDLSSQESGFLKDFVIKVTENGLEEKVNVDYDTWDNAASADDAVKTTNFDTKSGADMAKCDGEGSIPSWCFSQERADPIMTKDFAVQFKRTLGQTNVTKIGDGIYEVGGAGDPYDFSKGKSTAPILKEIAQLFSDITDSKNDQKLYTIIRKVFGLRARTGYEGFPVKIIVDISKGAAA